MLVVMVIVLVETSTSILELTPWSGSIRWAPKAHNKWFALLGQTQRNAQHTGAADPHAPLPALAKDPKKEGRKENAEEAGDRWQAAD